VLLPPLDVAPTANDFSFLPLLLVALLAIVAMITTLFLVRSRRNKGKM
jgi:hypothetical protein